MTLNQLLTKLQSKPGFLKLGDKVLDSTDSNFEKGYYKTLFSTGTDATNILSIYYIRDIATDDYTFQNSANISPLPSNKLAVLQNYLVNNYYASSLDRFDDDNNYAICTVYTDAGTFVTQSKIIIKKVGTSFEIKPIN